MVFEIRKNHPIVPRSRSSVSEIIDAVRTMGVGESIFIPKPDDKTLDEFRVSTVNAVKATLRRDNEQIGILAVNENGGIGLGRVDYKAPAPRKEQSPAEKAAAKKKREEVKKKKAAAAAEKVNADKAAAAANTNTADSSQAA